MNKKLNNQQNNRLKTSGLLELTMRLSATFFLIIACVQSYVHNVIQLDVMMSSNKITFIDLIENTTGAVEQNCNDKLLLVDCCEEIITSTSIDNQLLYEGDYRSKNTYVINYIQNSYLIENNINGSTEIYEIKSNGQSDKLIVNITASATKIIINLDYMINTSATIPNIIVTSVMLDQLLNKNMKLCSNDELKKYKNEMIGIVVCAIIVILSIVSIIIIFLCRKEPKNKSLSDLFRDRDQKDHQEPKQKSFDDIFKERDQKDSKNIELGTIPNNSTKRFRTHKKTHKKTQKKTQKKIQNLEPFMLALETLTETTNEEGEEKKIVK